MALPFSIVRIAAVLSGSSAALRLVRFCRADRSRRGAARNVACRSRWRHGSDLRRLVAALFIIPGRLVVRLGRRIEAGEQSVVGQLESVFDDECSVGVIDQVLMRDAVVLDGVVDQAAEKRKIGPGANLAENVGLRRRARKARIDHDHLGVAIALGLDRPLESAGMVLGWIPAHDQHHVGILHVDPAIGHGPAPESWSQT